MDDLPARHFVDHLQRGVRVTDADKDHEQDVAGAKVGRDIELGWHYAEESGSEAEAAHGAKRVEERVEGAGGRAGVEGREGEEKAKGREHPEHAEERLERTVGEGYEAGHLKQGDDRGRVAGRGTGIGVGEAGEGHREDGERERQRRRDVEERVAEGEDRELGHGRAEEQAADGGRWGVLVGEGKKRRRRGRGTLECSRCRHIQHWSTIEWPRIFCRRGRMWERESFLL